MSQALNGSFLDKWTNFWKDWPHWIQKLGPIHSALLSYTLNKVTFVTDLDGYLLSVDFRSLILDKFKTYLKHMGSLFQSKFIFSSLNELVLKHEFRKAKRLIKEAPKTSRPWRSIWMLFKINSEKKTGWNFLFKSKLVFAVLHTAWWLEDVHQMEFTLAIDTDWLWLM